MKTNQIVNAKRAKCKLALILMAVLPILWGCSSDNDDDNQGSFFTQPVSQRPTWQIDWSSDATEPDWQDPDATKYECSMNMLMELDEETARFSTDDDVMAVFIGGECRGVSYRNKMLNGAVAFLLHIKGSSEESGKEMKIRYYCASLHHMTIVDAVPSFTPNFLLNDTYSSVLSIGNHSQKYPVLTELTVMMPEKLPFTINADDMLAVFVGDECRGHGVYNPEVFPGWKVSVYSVQKGEQAQVRYYSAEKNCIYPFSKTFKLNGDLQAENVTF